MSLINELCEHVRDYNLKSNYCKKLYDKIAYANEGKDFEFIHLDDDYDFTHVKVTAEIWNMICDIHDIYEE